MVYFLALPGVILGSGVVTRPLGSKPIHRYENVVADIAFILDASQSDAAVFEAMKTFMIRFIKRFHIIDVGTHAAVITCGSTAKIRISLDQFMYTSSFMEEVRTFKHEKGCKGM